VGIVRSREKRIQSRRPARWRNLLFGQRPQKVQVTLPRQIGRVSISGRVDVITVVLRSLVLFKSFKIEHIEVRDDQSRNDKGWNHVEVDDIMIVANLPSRCWPALKFVYVSRWQTGRAVLMLVHYYTCKIFSSDM
jgi:hypothetical protein